MSHDVVVRDAHLSLKQRKEKLIREGASYRTAVRRSRDVVRQNLHVNVLARSVVHKVTSTAYGAIGNVLRLKGANLQTALPFVVTAASYVMKLLPSKGKSADAKLSDLKFPKVKLPKVKLPKIRVPQHALRTSAIVGAVGAIGAGSYLLYRRKKHG